MAEGRIARINTGALTVYGLLLTASVSSFLGGLAGLGSSVLTPTGRDALKVWQVVRKNDRIVRTTLGEEKFSRWKELLKESIEPGISAETRDKIGDKIIEEVLRPVHDADPSKSREIMANLEKSDKILEKRPTLAEDFRKIYMRRIPKGSLWGVALGLGFGTAIGAAKSRKGRKPKEPSRVSRQEAFTRRWH